MTSDCLHNRVVAIDSGKLEACNSHYNNFGDSADGCPASCGKHEMTSNAEYFARYGAIAALSCRMMMAARRARWNDLFDLEKEYVELVDALKEAGTGVKLDEAERLRKYALIREILADAAAIRDLVNPSLAILDQNMTSGADWTERQGLFGHGERRSRPGATSET